METRHSRRLPEFHGYVVDERLKEFRRVAWKNGEPRIEFIPFDSQKGDKLLVELLRTNSTHGVV